jgi:rsbT antagonist protein RsbS
MEISITQKLENLLLVTVPRDLMDEEILRLRRQVMQDLRRHRSRWVLLDFAAVDICDSFFGRFIQSMAHMAKLVGAEVILSGLQDAVVETLVDLGLSMQGIHAALDLDDALAVSRTLRPNVELPPDEMDELGTAPDGRRPAYGAAAGDADELNGKPWPEAGEVNRGP